MMTYQIPIPGPITLVDPMTGEPTKDKPVIFANTISGMCMVILQKKSLKALSVLEVRDKAVAGVEGQSMDVDDEQHAALLAEAEHPSGFTPQALLCLGPHLRAIVGATKVE